MSKSQVNDYSMLFITLKKAFFGEIDTWLNKTYPM